MTAWIIVALLYAIGFLGACMMCLDPITAVFWPLTYPALLIYGFLTGREEVGYADKFAKPD